MPLICVSSPKGGVGKTTLSANLAAQLARLGYGVVALDADPQNALGLHFGMALRQRHGFMISLREGPQRRNWRDQLQGGPYGLSYLPFGKADMETANAITLSLAVDPNLLLAPIREMLAAGAVVVADLPPGPSVPASLLLPLSQLALVVLLADAASIAQIPAVESGGAVGGGPHGIDPRRIGFVLNQLDLRSRLGRATAEAASRHLGQRLLGVVYRDENIAEAVAAQKIVATYAPRSKGAEDIAALTSVVLKHIAAAQTGEAA